MDRIYRLKALAILPAVCLVAILAAGCASGSETITIYPDGSGKIEIDYTWRLTGRQTAILPRSIIDRKTGNIELEDFFSKEVRAKLHIREYAAKVNFTESKRSGRKLKRSVDLKLTAYFDDYNGLVQTAGKRLEKFARDGENPPPGDYFCMQGFYPFKIDETDIVVPELVDEVEKIRLEKEDEVTSPRPVKRDEEKRLHPPGKDEPDAGGGKKTATGYRLSLDVPDAPSWSKKKVERDAEIQKYLDEMTGLDCRLKIVLFSKIVSRFPKFEIEGNVISSKLLKADYEKALRDMSERGLTELPEDAAVSIDLMPLTDADRARWEAFKKELADVKAKCEKGEYPVAPPEEKAPEEKPAEKTPEKE